MLIALYSYLWSSWTSVEWLDGEHPPAKRKAEKEKRKVNTCYVNIGFAIPASKLGQGKTFSCFNLQFKKKKTTVVKSLQHTSSLSWKKTPGLTQLRWRQALRCQRRRRTKSIFCSREWNLVLNSREYSQPSLAFSSSLACPSKTHHRVTKHVKGWERLLFNKSQLSQGREIRRYWVKETLTICLNSAHWKVLIIFQTFQAWTLFLSGGCKTGFADTL